MDGEYCHVAIPTSGPESFGTSLAPTDRHVHAGDSKMVAESPETSAFVHFFGTAYVSLRPLILLEKAVIRHAYRKRSRQGTLSAFVLYLRHPRGSRKFPRVKNRSLSSSSREAENDEGCLIGRDEALSGAGRGLMQTGTKLSALTRGLHS